VGLFWRASNAPARNGFVSGRVLKAFSVVVGAVLSSIALFYGALYNDARSVFVAAQSFRNFEFQYSADTGLLSFSGYVGPGFHSQLGKQFDLYDVNILSLESDGGLIDEAMQATVLIESRRISTYVPNFCNSACIVLFVAGHQRWARASANFGFHAVYPVADNRYSSLVLEIEGGKSDEYLASRGVPSTIIEEGRKYGPNEAYFVDAQTLRRSGFDVEIIQ
jgi:hypothetical protein